MKEKDTLVIGDFHFGTKTNSVQWLEEMEKYFVEIWSLVEAANVHKVIFLGDLFDVRYSINTLVGIKVKDMVREMIERNPVKSFNFLAGNHDYYSPKKEDMHYNAYEMVFGSEFMKEHDNVHFYTESPYLDEDGDLYLPWFFTEDKELFGQTVEHFKGELIKRIFCHSDLCTWDIDMIKNMNGNPVYSGHIHTPWTDEEHKLYNLGAALPLNFNDVNDKRYVYLLRGTEIVRKFENEETYQFYRYFNEEIFNLTKFDNCFVQLYIDKDLINKAKYIEKVKELKLNNPGISIRVVAIDKTMINDDEVGIDMNQDIKKYIDNNIPKNLYSKYETIKEKIEERGK